MPGDMKFEIYNMGLYDAITMCRNRRLRKCTWIENVAIMTEVSLRNYELAE
jgi:hypothetical protein